MNLLSIVVLITTVFNCPNPVYMKVFNGLVVQSPQSLEKMGIAGLKVQEGISFPLCFIGDVP